MSFLCSFRTSGALFGRRCGFSLAGRSRCLSFRCDELDSCAGSIAVNEDLVGYATDIRFADGVDLLQLAEKFSPVAEFCLVFGQLTGEAFVVAEAAEQVGAGAGFEAGELFVGDVFGS